MTDLTLRDPTARARAWAFGAIAAQVAFVFVWLIAPLWQPDGYSSVAHSISDMYAVTAPYAWVLIVALTISGAVVVAFSWLSVWPVLREAGWPATLGCVLLSLSIFGLGDLLTPFERLACQLADPACSTADQTANLGGTLDSTLSSIGAAAFTAAAFFLAAAMSNLDTWRSSARPAYVVAIMIVLSLVSLAALGGNGIGGLLERVFAFVGAAGIALLGWRIAVGPS